MVADKRSIEAASLSRTPRGWLTLCGLAYGLVALSVAVAQEAEPPAPPAAGSAAEPVAEIPNEVAPEAVPIGPSEIPPGAIIPPESGVPPEAADPPQAEVPLEAAAPAGIPPAAPETETTPMEMCSQIPQPNATMLENMRRRLSVTACASSAWLDGLFGDQVHYDEYRSTYGNVSAGGLWSDYDGFDPRLRFRVRLQLPQWDERISAFAGRVGEEDYISDTEGDFEALPTRQFGTLEDESVLVGLGYRSPERTGNDFDAGVGVRLDLPIDPYARARYEIVRKLGENYVFAARETVFWQNSEGFGTTTRVTLDRPLTDKLLLRWTNLGKFTEETIGLEWYTQFTLFQRLNERTGLAWQAQTEGETDNEVQLTRHSLRLIMRRQLQWEWLFLELRGGVSWPRRKLEEEREASPELGIAFEMQFGNKN